MGGPQDLFSREEDNVYYLANLDYLDYCWLWHTVANSLHGAILSCLGYTGFEKGCDGKNIHFGI